MGAVSIETFLASTAVRECTILHSTRVFFCVLIRESLKRTAMTMLFALSVGSVRLEWSLETSYRYYPSGLDVHRVILIVV